MKIFSYFSTYTIFKGSILPIPFYRAIITCGIITVSLLPVIISVPLLPVPFVPKFRVSKVQREIYSNSQYVG